MTAQIIYKREETSESILAQLRQYPLFQPLLAYLAQSEIEQLLQGAQERQFSVAELKKELNYNYELDKTVVPEQELAAYTALLRDNERITLRQPWLLRLDKKNLKKLLRVDKFYNGQNYLFKKFPAEKLLKNKTFLLPFLQTAALTALLQTLSDEQKITVSVQEDLNSLVSLKAMLAINKKIKEGAKILPDSATLILSEECNLRCVYCYEPAQKRDKTVLTFEKAKQVLRKFAYKSTVVFFGGEPMLHIDLMKKICEWGWEYRDMDFHLITNGQIIDREFLRNYVKYFPYVQLSCDGPLQPQDINRGHGSFRRAMDFYKACTEETGQPPALHPVLSRQSIPYLLDTVKWFYEVERTQECSALRWLPGDASRWEEKDFAVYAEQLCAIKEWYLKNDMRKTGFSIRAFAQAERDLLGVENGEHPPRRGEDSFCGAGYSLLAVLPSGQMIPCHHEYWCDPAERVYEEIDINEDSLGVNHMSELRLKDIPECNTCPQWGCCVCPGSFFFQSKAYTTPDKNWCRAGKLLIETAKSYVEELSQKINDSKYELDYLSAGVDYLLQKEVDIREEKTNADTDRNNN